MVNPIDLMVNGNGLAGGGWRFPTMASGQAAGACRGYFERLNGIASKRA